VCQGRRCGGGKRPVMSGANTGAGGAYVGGC
jgi:hypothetical protein